MVSLRILLTQYAKNRKVMLRIEKLEKLFYFQFSGKNILYSSPILFTIH